mmetsp:Transcript_6550/g.8511  ORF Transcript_6550/g.8511 Transcript_6550/m.8511 type:complete len:95 (-) Transcript_6550:252-536(-)|eukprot:CAMPEP_0198153626 /NCGR_PEP_ID=MMETSP1443-20131203/65038_1 /TAXON_ID=186043 /ORGANISM="Entomoneis sp., Strain CCMP2396" /LENGTH=94 /DNA_ID=CAMNT_0043820033 /DNA_START=351 /DNA_END=635 /DNA_ORIENTATION=-
MQIIIAAVLLLLFVPHCADGCEQFCSNKYKPAYFVYPTIATALGCLLINEGLRHRQTAKQVSRNNYNDQEDATFQALGQQDNDNNNMLRETELA